MNQAAILNAIKERAEVVSSLREEKAYTRADTYEHEVFVLVLSFIAESICDREDCRALAKAALGTREVHTVNQ